jgi:hypothetical protein
MDKKYVSAVIDKTPGIVKSLTIACDKTKLFDFLASLALR